MKLSPHWDICMCKLKQQTKKARELGAVGSAGSVPFGIGVAERLCSYLAREVAVAVCIAVEATE